jgi:hypothetical protein
LADWLAESLTSIVNADGIAVSGVPEIVTVLVWLPPSVRF